MITLYKQLRNLPVFEESKRFNEWLKNNYQCEGIEFHHTIGSMGSKKLNGYLKVPLTRQEHLKAESMKAEYCIETLPTAIRIMCEYIKHLENS